jgi:hypothetical protein
MGGTGGAGGDSGAGGAGGDDTDAGDMDAGGPGPVKNPTGIAVTGSNPTTEVHPSAGGAPYVDTCPANDVLIGFQGTMDADMDSANPWLKSLTGLCGTPHLMGSGPFTIAITPSFVLTTRGGPSDKMLPDAKCPDNQMIVGYRGNSGGYIDAVSFDCAPLVVTGDATNGYLITIDTGNITTVGPLGGTGGSGFGNYACDPGQVADGTNVHSGAWFDGFGLVCGVISLTGTKR